MGDKKSHLWIQCGGNLVHSALMGGTWWVVGVATLVGVAGGVFLLNRWMNPRSVIYTRLEIPNICLSDRAQVTVEVDVAVQVLSREIQHSQANERMKRICTQSCKQVLSPFTWADLEGVGVEVHESLKSKLQDNLRKAQLATTSIFLSIQKQDPEEEDYEE